MPDPGRRLRVLTWHVHGNYLWYLTQAPHDFWLVTRPGNPPLPVDGLPQPDLVVGDLRQLAQRLIDGA